MKLRDALLTIVLVMVVILLWRRLARRDAVQDRAA
jgi:hypothetical protein